jgi:hypothetical protein
MKNQHANHPMLYIESKEKKVVRSCFYEGCLFHHSYSRWYFYIKIRNSNIKINFETRHSYENIQQITAHRKANILQETTSIFSNMVPSLLTAHVFRKKPTSTSNNMTPSLHTLPVELIYRILDNVSDLTIFLSCRNVCARLNDITDTYNRYQVILGFTRESHFHYLLSELFFLRIYIYILFSC